MLEIPADVTVLEVLPAEGATFETTKQGERITCVVATTPSVGTRIVYCSSTPGFDSRGRTLT
jgi:hypothetical protein